MNYTCKVVSRWIVTRDNYFQQHQTHRRLTCFIFSMMSSFDTAVTSSTTLHFVLAHATKSIAHCITFMGFPCAPIRQMAMLGRHWKAKRFDKPELKSNLKLRVSIFLILLFWTRFFELYLQNGFHAFG